MKRVKQLFQVVMISIMLCCTTLTNVYAADSAFSTHCSDVGNLAITTQGRTITFTDLPETEKYGYCMVSLFDATKKTTVGKDNMAYVNGMTYSTSGLAAGNYYLQIYRAPQQYTTYWSMYYGTSGIKVKLTDDSVEVVMSPVYQNNISKSKKAKSSAMALEYYLGTEPGVTPENATIRNLAASITKGCKSDYDKVLKIHDWVCNNIYYDWDSYLDGSISWEACTPTVVLKNKRSVCSGYANLTASLLRAVGIPTKVVGGYALGVSTSGGWTEATIQTNTSNHAWNEAYVDGRWLILDTTWDSNNKYENGKFSTGTGLEGYRYFDPTVEAFSYDHKVTDPESFSEYLRALKGYQKDYFSPKQKAINLFVSSKKGKTSSKISFYTNSSYDKFFRKYAKITYKSSNSKVVTVTKNGTIKAKKKGTTYVAAYVKFDGTTVKHKIKVTVK